MPQLMPLNWMFSSLFLLLVVGMACFLYSEKVENEGLLMMMESESKGKILWCW